MYAHLRRALPSPAQLDLSLSLPYTVVAMRNGLLSYLATLEDQARAIAARLRSHDAQDSHEQRPSPSQTSEFLAPFYAQLEALREDLRRLALMFPSPPQASLPFPLTLPNASDTINSSQAALVATSQSLAADWERLCAALSVRLPPRPNMAILAAADPRKYMPNAPDMPTFSKPALPAMPAVTALVAKMQARFDSLQDTVMTLSIRDGWEKRRWGSADASASEQSFSLPSSSSLPSWESIMTSVRDSSNKGKAKAGEVVHSVWEMEHLMYQRACELANQGSRLIHYADLPMLWKNNEYILSGYRFIPLENWSALLKSAFELHNETINIHSHLAGALIVLPLFWPSKGLDDQTTWADRLVQTIYLIAAMKCLVSSVVWHVFAGCANAKWFERAACIDYSGVALLVAASVWTTIYNEFYCQPNLAMLYSLTTLVVGIIGAVVPWAAWFNERKNKSLRIGVFLGMCFTSLAPFFHATYEHGLFKTLNFLAPIIPSLLCYIVGLTLYATNFPERYWPGSFDIFGHAHQFWHVSIVLAILLHYRAALAFHANRFEFSCTDSSLASHGTASPESGGTSAVLAGAGVSALGALAQKLRGALLPQRLSDSLGSVTSSIGLGEVHGVEALNRADERIHGWRIVAGRLGGGAVGRWWNAAVDLLQTWF